MNDLSCIPPGRARPLPLLVWIWLLVAGLGHVQGAAFTNATPINIPLGGPAGLYPSLISLSNLTGAVLSVQVRLEDLQHVFPDDLDILLVGPAGQKVMLMSDAGGGNGLAGVDVRFSQSAPTTLPDSGVILAGMYQPTNYEIGEVLPGPAPAGPYGSDLSVFNGTDPNGTWRLFVSDDTTFNGGGAVAGGWSLTVELPLPPTITIQPQNQTVSPGTNVTFSVGVFGTPPFGYQWRRNGEVLVPFGLAGPSLTLTNVQATNAGNYTVVITNSANPGGVISSNAVLNVLGPLTLVDSPQNQTANPGETITFQVTAAGTPPLFYRWRLNGALLPDQTNSTLVLADVQATNGGAFSVTVFNDAEVFTTDPAILVVNAATHSPPANNFLNRPSLAGPTGVMQGNSSLATIESGEPVFLGGGNSVWCEWVAPSTGVVTLTARGSAFDTLLGVYNGTTLSNLTPVTSDDDEGGFYTSQLRFNAQAGKAYQWVLDGFSIGGIGGEFTLTWTLDPGGPVPVIVSAPQPQGVQQGNNAMFSVATLSPQDSFQWLFNGSLISGATNSTLTVTNVQTANVGFYSVQVSNPGGFTTESPPAALQRGHIDDLLAEDKIPFLNNRPGQGIPISVGLGQTGWNEFSSQGSGEPTDPEPCDEPLFTTLWQSVRADDGGVLRIDTAGSEVFLLVAVYEGVPTGIPALDVLVACDVLSGPVSQPAVVKFAAEQGSNYTAVVSALQGDGSETVRLTAMLGIAPPVVESPAYHSLPPGGSILLNMPATNWVPVPGCQWRLNNQPIPGATNTSLWLTNFSLTQTGAYSVVMSNFVDVATNTVAILDLSGPLTIGCELVGSGSNLRFVIQVTNATPFLLVTKTNLDPAIPWSGLFTNQQSGGTIRFTNGNLLAEPRRFFRLVPWP